ncbi:MAG: DUF4493 domain-containing protein [Bacteroidaceae bacterium]|nr:DUF4493 domain-containing protein [Bacteroidaceae bacterium]
MKKFLYIIAAVLCLVACQNDALQPEGFVSFSGVTKAQQEQVEVVTRAVETGLVVDIINEKGALVKRLTAADSAQPCKVVAGTYTLRAYSEDYEYRYKNLEPGTAKYWAETTFEVTAGETAAPSLQVPMANMGFFLTLPADFNQWFTDCSLQFSYGTTTRTLKPGGTVYLDATVNTDIAYTFTAVNIDGETMSKSGTFAAQAGKLHNVTYKMADQQIRVTYDFR